MIVKPNWIRLNEGRLSRFSYDETDLDGADKAGFAQFGSELDLANIGSN